MMAQQDDKSGPLPKETSALNQGTKMDPSTKETSALNQGTKMDLSKDIKASDQVTDTRCKKDTAISPPKDHHKSVVENGVLHHKGIDSKESATQHNDIAQDTALHSGPSPDAESDLQATHCESCSSGGVTENNILTSGDNVATDGVRCEKCHRNFTLSTGSCNSATCEDHESKTTKSLPELEKCPMCGKTFESAEALDDHLLLPESCRKVPPEDVAPSLSLVNDAAASDEHAKFKDDDNQESSEVITVDKSMKEDENDTNKSSSLPDTTEAKDVKEAPSLMTIANDTSVLDESDEHGEDNQESSDKPLDSEETNDTSVPSLLPDTSAADDVMEAVAQVTSENNNESIADKSPLFDGGLDMEVTDETDENDVVESEADDDGNIGESEIYGAPSLLTETHQEDAKGTDEQFSPENETTITDHSPSPPSMEVSEEMDHTDSIRESASSPCIVEDSPEDVKETEELSLPSLKEDNTLVTEDTSASAVTGDADNIVESDANRVQVLSSIPDAMHEETKSIDDDKPSSPDGVFMEVGEETDDDVTADSQGKPVQVISSIPDDLIAESKPKRLVEVLSSIPDAIHDGHEETKSVNEESAVDKSSSSESVQMGNVEETSDDVAAESKPVRQVEVLSSIPDAIHDGHEETKSVNKESAVDKSASSESVDMEVVEETNDGVTAVSKPERQVEVLSSIPDAIHDGQEETKSKNESVEDISPSSESVDMEVVEEKNDDVTTESKPVRQVKVLSSIPDAIHDGQEPKNKESVEDKSLSSESDDKDVVEGMSVDTAAESKPGRPVKVLSTIPDDIHDSQEQAKSVNDETSSTKNREGAVDEPPSSESASMEVVEEMDKSEVTKTVKEVSALPDTVQDANDSEEKLTSSQTDSDKSILKSSPKCNAEEAADNVAKHSESDGKNADSTAKLNAKPVDKESSYESAPSTNVAKSQDADSDESGIIELGDSDSDKSTSPTKVTTKDETTENSTKSTDDKKPSGDGNQTNNSSLVIKKKFTTGNETLDQDIVEILQDTTVSRSGRVTRSMRKVKEVPASDGKVKDAPSPDAKRLPKAVTPGAGNVKVIQQSTVKNSLQLQLPASAVVNGAKFMITIPKGNSSNTPPGQYLVTVSPTPLGDKPKVKTVMIKDSANTVASVTPAADGTCISVMKNSSPPTATPQLLTSENKPSEIVESDVQEKKEQDMQLRKTLMLAKQTKKVYVRELEQIDDVIFECPKCKTGFPHMLLVQLHMEDCCHHPPTQKPSVHIRIPTDVLLKFYHKQVSNWTSKQPPAANRQTYQCVCCQEVLLCRNYRIGKYYPILATHFAKHTSPAVKVVNYTKHSQIKELGDVLTVHSKKAVEWIDDMVPPFIVSNKPVSHKMGTLEGYLCTGNKLHQESLLLLEYDSDELNEEMYLERRKKEKRKKKKRGRYGADDNGAYVCSWRASIMKEDSSIVDVNEIGTPKSAFPTDILKSGSLKHSILHSPSKATSKKQANSTQGKSRGRKKKNNAATVKEVSKQLVFDDNRRRSPRKGGADVLVSLPQKRHRNLEASKTKTKSTVSDNEIILLSSEDEVQSSVSTKVPAAQAKKAKMPSQSSRPIGRGNLPRQGSVEDDSSRGSMVSLPEGSTRTQAAKSATSSRAASLDSRLPSANDGVEADDRPPSRGSNSSIICLSDSNEDDNRSPKADGKDSMAERSKLVQQPIISTTNVTQKTSQNNAAENVIPESPISAKRRLETIQKVTVGPQSAKNTTEEEGKVEEEVKKRQVPEAAIDEDDEVTLLSDAEEDEDEGVDLNSDDYDALMLDKHQVKTYFQQSKDEAGIYECSLGGSTSCECVSESDLFEHMSQHLHVVKVNPQKRSKTILFKGKVVPQYLKLTRHQIWAHFCNITLDNEMETCDEYMQQYKQCRWAACAQRVWTKYGRLSHHLRSHLRFTQIDGKRYQKMKGAQSVSGADSDGRSSYQDSPARDTLRTGVSSDQVVCLPEDLILGKFKYGKSPDKNIRGTFGCLVCSYCHHLETNAVAVMTVKVLACHLKHHLPQGNTRMCLITPKALKSSLDHNAYSACVRSHQLPTDVANISGLPQQIVTSCYYALKMKFVEVATMEAAASPALNKDGVLYRCLYAGCLIGIHGGVGKGNALLRHIREHVPVVSGSSPDKGGSPSLQLRPLEPSPNPSVTTGNVQNRKRKASTDANEESDDELTIVSSSKHVRTLDFGGKSNIPNMQETPVEKRQVSVTNPRPVPTFLPDRLSKIQDEPVTSSLDKSRVTVAHSNRVQQTLFADGTSTVQTRQGMKAGSDVIGKPNLEHPKPVQQTFYADGTSKVQVTPQNNGPRTVAAETEAASSDDDIVELIDDESSQESTLMLSDEQPMEIASQDDSQDSVTAVDHFQESPTKNANEPSTGLSEDSSNRGGLPEWSTSNRGVNSATGIEPSRDSPSRTMDELRQNPNDVIVCSMPDVEAYFTEHIVKFASYVSSMTFGKPSYSCPECGMTGLRGETLKQHLELHVGKTIKWKGVTKRNEPPNLTKDPRTMLKLKRLFVDRNRSPRMKQYGGRQWEGQNGAMRRTRKDVRSDGHGVKKARQNFNNILGRILQRERNIRKGKITRSPLKRMSSLGAMYSKAKASTCRRSVLSEESLIGNPVENDLSTRVKGQSSSTKDADTVKQSFTDVVDKQAALQESCIAKSNTSQTVTEVVDLVDSDALEIISINSDDAELSNAIQIGQGDSGLGEEPEETPSGDDLFLTIDDILKVYFTKEEKQRSRKGIGMNFVVVQYKCRRCNFTTLTVLDVPEHVAFHIKRKVILKIAMDK